MKSKILIIDDEPDNLEYMARVLEKMNADCDIYQSNDGLMGFEVIKKELPDLVITDWQMPNTGIDLIKKMRQESVYKNIPVIVYSGFVASTENLEIALEAGASDYVNKPIRPMELIARSHVLLALYGDKNEQVYSGSKKIVFNLLKSELASVYDKLKLVIPQISGKNTEFEPLKEELNQAIKETIEAPESLLIPIQRFLLTNSAFEVPPQKNIVLHQTLAGITAKLNGIITKKDLSVENKFSNARQIWMSEDILHFTLWYLIKECLLAVMEHSKIVLKEGNSKSKNKTTLCICMSHRSFPKDIMAKIETNWKFVGLPEHQESRGCVGMLNNLKSLLYQNQGDIEFSSSRWKGVRLLVHLPVK